MILTIEKLHDGTFTEVEWEVDEHDLVDDAGDGHVFYYYAEGTGENGEPFDGTAVFCDGEFVEIENANYLYE